MFILLIIDLIIIVLLSDYLFQCLFNRTNPRVLPEFFFIGLFWNSMVDTVKMTNENDDWEVAVDNGEFDKRLQQQEKDRAAIQVIFNFSITRICYCFFVFVKESISSTVTDDDNQNSLNINLMKSNKPIRILKRPTSQSQLPVSNDLNNSNQPTTTTTNDTNSPFFDDVSSSTTVPNISIIPRNHIKDTVNSSQIRNTPTSSNLQSTKPTIKTYEQRELEYRLARLR